MKYAVLLVLALIATALFTMITIQAQGGQTMNTEKSVILINPFTVPEGKLDETIKSWEAGRDFLSQQPGYISTKLHQSLSPDAQYQLINVAEWESPETVKAAISAMSVNAVMPPVEGVVPAPALYNIVRN